MTISSLVSDMMDSYANVTRGLQEFSWQKSIATAVRDFVTSQQCFFFDLGRAPVQNILLLNLASAHANRWTGSASDIHPGKAACRRIGHQSALRLESAGDRLP